MKGKSQIFSGKDEKCMKEVKFLQRGLFEKPFMQTRIKTHSMTLHEKLLGFLLGPCGVMVLYAMISQLRELYYTSVVPIDSPAR